MTTYFYVKALDGVYPVYVYKKARTDDLLFDVKGLNYIYIDRTQTLKYEFTAEIDDNTLEFNQKDYNRNVKEAELILDKVEHNICCFLEDREEDGKLRRITNETIDCDKSTGKTVIKWDVIDE